MTVELNRRQFLAGAAVAATGAAVAGLTGCSSGSSSASTSASASAAKTVPTPEKMYFMWEPGASEGKYENMRDLMAEAIEAASGIPTEPATSTDYNIAIESLNSGKAHYASLGAKEYVELHKKNPACQVAWVISDGEGNLNPVSYHSQIIVAEENASKYFRDGKYGVTKEDMQGKNMAFVDVSSTSGYVIPSIALATEFGIENADDLGEPGKFFNNVLFQTKHQLALLAVLQGDADFCGVADYGTITSYYDVVEGENGALGTLYKVKDGLAAPFDELAGRQFRSIDSYEVPAVPFVVNLDVVPEDINKKVIEYMGSETVYNNKQLFKDPSDKDTITQYTQSTGKVRFIECPDSYYDNFRKLIGEE